MLSTYKKYYSAALDACVKEIEQYKNEEDLWKIIPGTLNSGGNLALHLIGNLKYFFGTVLGNTGYVRNRDAEFALKNIPAQQVIAQLKEAKDVVLQVLENLTISDFEKDYPTNVQNIEGSIGNMILRLVTHLNYHLGQINYHRRIITT